MDVDLSRLVLRRPVDDDADEVLALALDRAVLSWNPIRTVVDLDSARAWCQESSDWEAGSHATWVAIDGPSGKLVATCAVFDIDMAEAVASIGYRVPVLARGRGVARTCVDAVSRWSFAQLPLARLQLAHAVGNEASCHVAQAAGYSYEGTLRSSYVDRLGVRHDEHVHGRLATDAEPAIVHLPAMRA